MEDIDLIPTCPKCGRGAKLVHGPSIVGRGRKTTGMCFGGHIYSLDLADVHRVTLNRLQAQLANAFAQYLSALDPEEHWPWDLTDLLDKLVTTTPPELLAEYTVATLKKLAAQEGHPVDEP